MRPMMIAVTVVSITGLFLFRLHLMEQADSTVAAATQSGTSEGFTAQAMGAATASFAAIAAMAGMGGDGAKPSASSGITASLGGSKSGAPDLTGSSLNVYKQIESELSKQTAGMAKGGSSFSRPSNFKPRFVKARTND